MKTKSYGKLLQVLSGYAGKRNHHSLLRNPVSGLRICAAIPIGHRGQNAKNVPTTDAEIENILDKHGVFFKYWGG